MKLRIVVTVFTLFFSVHMMGEVNAGRPETDEKGCLCKYNSQNGQITPIPFIKTGEKEYGSEEGEPEIWGYIVTNLGNYEHERDKDGNVHPVNVLKSKFVPADGKAHEIPTGTMTRRYVCRLWNIIRRRK